MVLVSSNYFKSLHPMIFETSMWSIYILAALPTPGRINKNRDVTDFPSCSPIFTSTSSFAVRKSLLVCLKDLLRLNSDRPLPCHIPWGKVMTDWALGGCFWLEETTKRGSLSEATSWHTVSPAGPLGRSWWLLPLHPWPQLIHRHQVAKAFYLAPQNTALR